MIRAAIRGETPESPFPEGVVDVVNLSSAPEIAALRQSAEEKKDASSQAQEQSEIADEVFEIANDREDFARSANLVQERESQEEQAEIIRAQLVRSQQEEKLDERQMEEQREAAALARSYVAPKDGAAGHPFVVNIEQFDPAGTDVMNREPSGEEKSQIPVYLQPVPEFVPSLPDNIAQRFIEADGRPSQIRRRRERKVNLPEAPPDVQFRMREVDIDKRLRDGDLDLEDPMELQEVKIPGRDIRTETPRERRGFRILQEVLQTISSNLRGETSANMRNLRQRGRAVESAINEASRQVRQLFVDTERQDLANQIFDVSLARLNESPQASADISDPEGITMGSYIQALPFLIAAMSMGRTAARNKYFDFPSGPDESIVLSLLGLLNYVTSDRGSRGDPEDPDDPDDPDGGGGGGELPDDPDERELPGINLRLSGLIALISAAIQKLPEGVKRRIMKRINKHIKKLTGGIISFDEARKLITGEIELIDIAGKEEVIKKVDKMLTGLVSRTASKTKKKVSDIVQGILSSRKIDLTDEERSLLEEELKGKTDVKEIQDVDNEAVSGELRPSFTQTGTNEDRETPEEALRERLQFASLSHVKPGFGNGSNNPLYLRNVRWDRDVRGIAPGADPRLTIKPSERVDYEPFYHYAPLTTLYHRNTTATNLVGSGGRWMTDEELQNIYAHPVSGANISSTRPLNGFTRRNQFIKGSRAQEVYDLNTGRNLTGTFSGAPVNIINSMPAPITDRLHTANGQNNYDQNRRIEPVCLVKNPTERKNKWYYANSTTQPMEGTDWENRKDKDARPSRSFPTFMFQSGTVRSSTSLLPF
jgi:hypothetical protein